jgi:uncharacterized protein (TIGR03437 family)
VETCFRLAAVLAVCYLPAATQTYSIRTIAGTNYSGDGLPAPAGILVQPEGLAVDPAGNIYIADAADDRIRKVDVSGRISTLAGPASAERLRSPYDVCVDAAGTVYVADLGNASIRKITVDGRITTVAGGGTGVIDLNVAQRATQVQLTQPRNIALDPRGTLYISDFGAHRVYKVTADGMLAHVGGTGQAGVSEDGLPATRFKLSSPAGIAVDTAGNIYVADAGNRRIVRIYGGFAATVRDMSGRALEFATPTSVAIDAAQNLYIGDGSGIVTRLSVGGALSFLSIQAKTVALDSAGRMLVVNGRQVQRFDDPRVTIIAGTGLGGFAGDGRPATEWRFNGPSAVVRDASGNLYIADSGNGRVRQLSPAGDLTTLIGGLARPTALALDAGGRLYVADAASGFIHRYDRGATRVFSTGSEGKPFVRPSALAFDAAGNLFVADSGNNLIRKVSQTGAVTVVAGGGSTREDTHPLRVRLIDPAGLAFDTSGNLWFTEAGSGLVRKINPAGGLETLTHDLKEPRGLKAARDGSLFLCETGAHRVIRVLPDGTWQPVAGTGDPGTSDAETPGLESRMMSPLDVWVDGDDSVVVADAGAARIRQLRRDEASGKPPTSVVKPELRILHAASLKPHAIAPGQLFLIQGDADLIDEGHTSPAETEIKVAGLPAAVLSVERRNIVAQLPVAAVPGMAELTLSHRGLFRGATSVPVAALAPGIFTESNGSGHALAVNEDGTRNSADCPANRGSVVSLYGTGHPDGVIRASVQIGGIDADVEYAGPAPGQPGVFQINVRTPAGFAPSGVLPLTVVLNGVSAQAGLSLFTR